MASYTVYHGKFPCHECKEVVTSMRVYAETKSATWMCKSKHISSVSFGKRKKSDFDGEK